MKKIISIMAIILVLLIVLFGVTGCGEQSTGKSESLQYNVDDDVRHFKADAVLLSNLMDSTYYFCFSEKKCILYHGDKYVDYAFLKNDQVDKIKNAVENVKNQKERPGTSMMYTLKYEGKEYQVFNDYSDVFYSVIREAFN